ncbi:MAG: site-2 protease family protein [Patescibacteria group bacterium]|nr:site-2 protease family protein [Patescibacteria group bacterium]
MNILIFIAVLLVLILSHEFGHFIVAKKAGIRVDEFAFGFPPRLFKFKKGETTYSFNALPFGGYVKIFGESPNKETLNSKRSFISKPKYIQVMVLIAGVVMNFLVAWLLLSVGFMSGLPSSASAVNNKDILKDKMVTIVSVNPNSPADQAGLKAGDRVMYLSVGASSTKVPSTESVQYFIKKHSEEEINISFLRAQEEMETVVTPSESMIGISLDLIGTLKLPFFQSLWEGLKLSANLLIATVVGFADLIGDAFAGQADFSSITGPIGIIGVVGDAAGFGFVYLLSFTALISINLIVLNLIPFPALDGGRLLFLLIEKIKGSYIKPQIAGLVNTIGFGILILLMLVVTYHDILKMF